MAQNQNIKTRKLSPGVKAAPDNRRCATPMAQQNPDHGEPSAQQTLIQLVGSSEPKSRRTRAKRAEQNAELAKVHH